MVRKVDEDDQVKAVYITGEGASRAMAVMRPARHSVMKDRRQA